MNKRIRLIIGILVSIAFLYFSMRKVDWAHLWDLFRQANYFYLIPAAILIVCISWARAYRWRLLMYPDEHIPLSKLFRIVNIGYCFNNIFPAKAGELVRAYLVGREVAGGIGQSLSTLLIERLLDVLSVVVLLVILLPLMALPDWATQGGLFFGIAAVGGTALLVILSRYGAPGVEWLWRFVGRVPIVGHPQLKAALINLLDGFRVLTVARQLPGILIGSALVWLGYALFNYTFLAVFRMTELPFAAAAVVLCATGFSMVLPSSPGAMGVFEWAGVQALAVFGVAQSAAFGYTLGLHMFTNIMLILLGILGLLREGLSWADLRHEAIVNTAPPSSASDPSS